MTIEYLASINAFLPMSEGEPLKVAICDVSTKCVKLDRELCINSEVSEMAGSQDLSKVYRPSHHVVFNEIAQMTDLRLRAFAILVSARYPECPAWRALVRSVGELFPSLEEFLLADREVVKPTTPTHTKGRRRKSPPIDYSIGPNLFEAFGGQLPPITTDIE